MSKHQCLIIDVNHKLRNKKQKTGEVNCVFLIKYNGKEARCILLMYKHDKINHFDTDPSVHSARKELN